MAGPCTDLTRSQSVNHSSAEEDGHLDNKKLNVKDIFSHRDTYDKR